MINEINILNKFSTFSDHWTPKIVGELNGQYVKLAKVQGEMIWHSHAEEDDLFYIVKGTLFMDYRDRETTTTTQCNILIIARGV